MLTAEGTTLVLLAAGRASRFGGNKLSAILDGKPLGLHAAATLAGVPFLMRVAVVEPERALDYAAYGFEVIANADRDEGIASSLHIGVAAARRAGATAVMVALADMPCVTAAHVRRLFDASSDADSLVASSDGRAAKPPALFGAAHFDALLATRRDYGARDLIRAARTVVAGTGELVDVDTLEDLERLHASS